MSEVLGSAVNSDDRGMDTVAEVEGGAAEVRDAEFRVTVKCSRMEWNGTFQKYSSK